MPKVTDGAHQGLSNDAIRQQVLNNKELHTENRRSIDLEIRAETLNSEDRTVEVSFCSEYAEGKRWYGIEILDCSPASVRLGRLNNNANALFNHDRDHYVGVVEKAWLDADKKGRALVRFGKSEFADSKFKDVQDRVLTKISVSYEVNKIILEKEASAQNDYDVYRVVDWEPFELSFVTIPFDDTVGYGRSLDQPKNDLPTSQARESGFFNAPKQEKKMPQEKTMEDLEAEGRALKEKMTAAEFETARRDAIIELGVKYADHLTPQDIADAIRSAKTPPEVQDMVIERMSTKHADVSAAHIGMDKKDIKRYSIANAVRSMISGDWKGATLEREAAEACSQRFGSNVQFTGRNLVLPYDVMTQRDFTAGTAAEAGNLIATDLRGDLFTDVLRNQLVMGQLGATILYGLTGNVDIPRKTSPTSLGWLAEVAAAAETQPVTSKVTLSPKRIGGYVEFSKQSVIQSALAVEPMLRQDINDTYMDKFEDAAINGLGSSNQPRGIRNVSGIGSVVGGTDGAQLAWSHVVGLETAVANVNANPGANAAYLVNTKFRGAAKQTLKAAGLPFIWGENNENLNGYRAEVSNLVPSNLTKGSSSGVCSSALFSANWQMLVLATFGAIELTLDDLTQAVNGMNRLVLNAFVDVACRRPADFAAMDDLLTA